MSKKEHLSIRIKKNDNTDRINIEEWENLLNLQYYFKKSTPYIIEAALAYNKYTNDMKTNDEYSTNSFDVHKSRKVQNSALERLTPYIKTGKINKKLEIFYNNGYICIPAGFIGIDVAFFSPYIISFETSIETRITIDLTRDMLIEDTKEKLTIKFL